MMSVINTLLISAVLACSAINAAKADGIFYLVRHAEKQHDGTKDPHLTDQGRLRADYLAKQLSSAGITKIYSTDYHRTQATAKPLADLLGLSVESYNPSDLEKLADKLKRQAGRVLVVGHSNTTPILAALLSGQKVDVMNDGDYQDLYQVVISNDQAQLTRLTIFPIKSAANN